MQTSYHINTGVSWYAPAKNFSEYFYRILGSNSLNIAVSVVQNIVCQHNVYQLSFSGKGDYPAMPFLSGPEMKLDSQNTSVN